MTLFRKIHFPDSNIRIVFTFRILLSGKQYPESEEWNYSLGFTSDVDPHEFQCGSGSSIFPQCGSGSRSRFGSRSINFWHPGLRKICVFKSKLYFDSFTAVWKFLFLTLFRKIHFPDSNIRIVFTFRILPSGKWRLAG